MTFLQLRHLLLGTALASFTLFAQQPDSAASKPAAGAPQTAQTQPKVDHSASYYHYSLAHMYEEMAGMFGRSEYVTKAIEEYKLAIESDPESEFLRDSLAELYVRGGRVRDALLEAQDSVRRDPNNLQARKVLGRIYLRSMGDGQPGTQSRELVKLALEQYEAIIKIEPNSADNHLVLGHLYFLNRELDKAESEFKTALQLEPGSEEAIARLAYLYNDQGDSKKATEFLNSIPEEARNSKVYSMLGDTYEQQKDFKKAIIAYTRAVELDRENLDARRGLAQNLLNDNQPEAALQQYMALEQADPQDAQAPLRIAEIYRHMGKFDLALEDLKKASALAPDSQEIPYNQALVLEALGRYDEAADTLQMLLTRTAKPAGNYTPGERGNRALFLEHLGNIYRQQGKPLQSLETFRKMTDLGGDEASRGYQAIIDTYREQKRWAEAGKIAREAVTRQPNDKALKLTLATQLADDGKAEESIQIAKSLLKGQTGNREGYLGLSQVYSRLKRWKEAEDALTQAEKLSASPEEKRGVQFYQAAFAERQKKYDLAEQIFRQILQQDPGNAPTLNYLGYMMADRNQHTEEALKMIQKALELDPQNGAYLDSLGWAYFKLGKFDLAEENLRKAADKSPKDATVQDHLGELYGKTGRLKLAATHWEHALDEWGKSAPADVDQQDVSRVQKKLESVKVKLAQQQAK
ncbi:MAG TPA: tetratricopeptide repeat protein [Alphaproteobacteria bacterium]|nr:tetratricopeptide repeat protein [Alphaproteobacteria bacterium]